LTQKAGIVLVVDDERDHADGVAEALEKSCDKAIAVYDGRDALEILRSRQVDVVVTDLKLGGDIDGLAVLEEARAQDESTQVILITAYATINTCKAISSNLSTSASFVRSSFGPDKKLPPLTPAPGSARQQTKKSLYSRACRATIPR